MQSMNAIGSKIMRHARTAGATFVARGFSGDPNFLAELIKEGIKHKGFSIIDVESPCVSFNKVNTYDWARKAVYKLDSTYNSGDIKVAMDKALEYELNPDKLATGIIYKTDRPTYEEQDIALKTGNNAPLVTHKLLDPNEMLELLSEHSV